MKIRLPLLAALVLLAGTSRAADLRVPLANYLKAADAILIVKLEKRGPGNILYSLPPSCICALRLAVGEVIRAPFKRGAVLNIPHLTKRDTPPDYPLGKVCVVVLEKSPVNGKWSVICLEPATKWNLKAARAAK